MYSPIKNVVTFGYEQAREQEMREKEEESLKNFNKYRDQYTEATQEQGFQDNVNKYPGYEQNKEMKQKYSDNVRKNRDDLQE